MSGNIKSHQSTTPKVSKDLWVTPQWVVDDATALIGQDFELDAAASGYKVAKADQFITPEMDALSPDTQWKPSHHGAVWLNPPFSEKVDFLIKANAQAKRHGLTIVVCIPYERITNWFKDHVHNLATVVYIPDNRINYINPETGFEMSGVPFASCLAVFTPLTTREAVYVDYVRKFSREIHHDNENSIQLNV